MDDAGFDRLLALAGPSSAPGLVAQFLADLDEVAARLDAGFGAADATALRKASHVLIALAGTVGAADLTDAARRLHAAASAGDGAAMAGERASVTAGIGEMRLRLAARAGRRA